MGITVTLTDDDALDYLASRNVPQVFAEHPNSVVHPLESTGFPPPVLTETINAAFAQPAPTHLIPPPPPQQQAPGIEVDKAGLPWDGRIHASSRAVVADGTWRQKRGVDPTLLAQVTAELQQTMGLSSQVAPAAVFPAAPPPPAAPLPPFAPTAASPAIPVSSIPAAPSNPPVGAATVASPSDTPTFPRLMQKITQAFTSKQITQEQITAAVNAQGLASLPMLVNQPHLVPAVATYLGLTL